MSMKNVSKSQLAFIGASLLCYSEVQSKTTKHKYDVNWALIPLCPFRASFKGKMFSSADLQLKTFNANTLLSPVQSGDNNVPQSNDVPNTSHTIVKLVSYSNVLQKTFKAK